MPLLVTGSNDALDNDLRELFTGSNIVTVTKVPGKSFVFVEFDNYESAMGIVTKSLNETLKLNNKALTIGLLNFHTMYLYIILISYSSFSMVFFHVIIYYFNHLYNSTNNDINNISISNNSNNNNSIYDDTSSNVTYSNFFNY